MKKLIYTSEYREKIINLRNDLDLKYGKEVRQKVFSEIDHRIQQLKAHHYLGISVREKYGVNCDYYYIYVAHNLVFYQVDESSIILREGPELLFSCQLKMLLTQFLTLLRPATPPATPQPTAPTHSPTTQPGAPAIQPTPAPTMAPTVTPVIAPPT